MDVNTVADLFSIILLAGIAGFFAALVRPPSRRFLSRQALPLAGLVAVGATAGSLYFSEIANFNPCLFCWYQRIAMYPLAVILPIAALRRDLGIGRYAIPLAAIGAAISAYHVRVQLFPEEGGSCDLSNPCSGKWIDALGFLTIPMLAGLSFLLIIGSLVVASRVSTDRI